MKKILILIVLLAVPVLGAFLAPAEADALQTSSAVQIPQALKDILSALLLAGVTLGLQLVFDTLGLDLRGIGTAVAVATSAFVIGELQGYIDAIPATYDYLVSIALNIAVVILSGLGFLRFTLHRPRAEALFT